MTKSIFYKIDIQGVFEVADNESGVRFYFYLISPRVYVGKCCSLVYRSRNRQVLVGVTTNLITGLY